MSDISIYNYQCPRTYMLDYLTKRQSVDRSFSVRKWSKEMGLSSHTILNFLINGKRPFRLSHAQFLTKGFGLNSQESLYLKALIQFSEAKNIEEKEYHSLCLATLNPGKSFTSSTIENYQAISDWSFAAILSVCDLSNFDGTIEGIYSRLKSKLSINEVKSKLLTLKNIGLICLDQNNKIKPTYKKTTTSDDVHNEGVKKYHKSVAEQGIKAIDDQSLDEREFQSFAVSINKQKIPKIKQMIRKFIAQLETETQQDLTDEVYQFNIQFFRLTEDSSISNKRMKEVKGVVPDTTFLQGEKNEIHI